MRKIILSCGLLAVAGGVVLDQVGGDRIGPAVTGGVWPILALIVLAAGGVVALAATSRTARGTGLFLVVVGAGGLAAVVASAVASGEPGPATGLLAVGALAVAVGAATPLCVANRWGAAAAAVLILVAAAGAAVGVSRVPVRVRTAPDTAAAAVSPVLRPGPVRWRWTAPGGVDDVVPTAFGVAVRSVDTVSGVDGTTGVTRWTYRRVGSRIAVLTVSPDGRSIVAAHAADDDRFGLQRVAVLDAATGALRWDDVVGGWPDAGPLQLTDHVLTVLEELPATDRDQRAFRIAARSLADGARVWERVPPPGCRLGGDGLVERTVRNPEPLRARDVVVGWQDCGGERTGVGLDDRDGSVRWSLPPVAVVVDGYVGPEFFPVALPDAGHVVFARGGGGSLLVDPTDGRVVATLPFDDVALLRARPGATWALLGADGGSIPRAALDPATGAVIPIDPGCTAGEPDIRVAVTAAAAVRLCGAGPGFGLSVDGGPVTPVDPGPPAPDRVETGLESYRGPSPYLVVPAPGALVVGATSTDPAVLVGLGPATTP